MMALQFLGGEIVTPCGISAPPMILSKRDKYEWILNLRSVFRTIEFLAVNIKIIVYASNFCILFSFDHKIYDSIGEYSKALSSYEKVLEIKEQSLPLNHPNLATSYHNIGAVHSNMGEYSKALSFYQRAVDIGQQSLSLNHPDLQQCRRNLERV
jgi:tetratricopeptide (TPR) repeat protein